MLSRPNINIELLKESEVQKLANLLTDKNPEQRKEGLNYLKELGGMQRLFYTTVFTPVRHKNQEENFCQLIKSIFQQFAGGFDYVHPKTQQTCLVYAIAVSNLAGVSRVLQMGSNPNFILPTGHAALYYCCAATCSPEDLAALKKHSSLIIAELRKFGANPNQPGMAGHQYPLINVLLATKEQLLITDSESLLEFPNIDVNVKSTDNYTPLFAAARRDNAKMVAKLIKLGAHINAVNVDNATALMGAVQSRSWNCALLLLNADADSNIPVKYRGKNGEALETSPLSIAVEYYTTINNPTEKRTLINLIKLLLNHRADPYVILGNVCSVLTRIIENDANELFECMVAAGIDFNRVCDTNHKTALMVASIHGRMKMVKRMAETGTNLTFVTADKRSALFYASANGRLELVKHLLPPSRDLINLSDDLGMTPLYGASQNGHVSVVECLLKNGATIKAAESVDNQSPFHIAALQGMSDVIRLLILHSKNKQDVNALMQNGATPLMIAAMGGYLDTVKLLVEAGADPTVQLPDGGNALSLAYRHNHRKVCEFLYIKIYYRDMIAEGMEVECQLISKLLCEDEESELTFNISFKPTLFTTPPAANTPKNNSIVTDADVISGFKFLREQGFSADEIKKMQKSFDGPSPTTSSSSTSSALEETFTWMGNAINSTSADVMRIESNHSGGACFLYFDKTSLVEQGCDFTEQLTKFRCKFAPQDNTGGIVKLRGKPLEIEVQQGQETTPQFVTDEFKFIDREARILCYRINADNGRATLFVGCVYTASGLHQTSDRTRLNKKVQLHLPSIKPIAQP